MAHFFLEDMVMVMASPPAAAFALLAVHVFKPELAQKLGRQGAGHVRQG